MATLCRNCNHALVYDPAIRKMHCAYCGSAFEAEDVESEVKKYRENERVLTRGEVFGDDEMYEEFLEGYVYTCSECGGEIVLHGSESSTKCIFCGNPNVVFSRMAKEKMPDYIIPFSITREQAMTSIRSVIDHAVFLPKELKNLKIEDVRGIYLPYWIVNANHEEAAVLQVKAQNPCMTKYQYVGRKGSICLQDFPIDGCRILSDESSTRLEPFDLSAMKPFDEDYLLGFYSNSSDITYDDLYLAAQRRGKEIFDQGTKADTGDKYAKVMGEVHETAILNNYKYAMFPVWFVTFRYNGKPHTILVNGQTGKVVCGLPWNKKKYWIMSILLGIAIMLALVVGLNGILKVLQVNGTGKESSEYVTARIIAGFGFGFSSIASICALAKLSKVKKQLDLTQSATTFRFVSKRQE
ncbi:MAG: hypothetical protein J5750_00575 [Clostridiales bacterium]|nr:hypothetical protein [Clostridiales bacterium]